MSADNRSTHTDALATLGTILTGNAGRDAIHLAVEPVTAATQLWPGEEIYANGGMAYKAGRTTKNMGIVDPFLKGRVEAGQRFWLIVHPRQITSLRHVWEHPDFPGEHKEEPAKAKVDSGPSEEWIRSFADGKGLEYEVLMNGAREWLQGGEYLCFGGLLEGEHVPDEFWDYYEIVTGHVVGSDLRGNFFTCSC